MNLEKTMITFKGYPQDGGLYTGYDVLRDGQKIGFIGIGGSFRKNTDEVSLIEKDKEVVKTMCQVVHNMPSEWGCLGVGELPNTSWEEYSEFMRRNNIRHDLD